MKTYQTLLNDASYVSDTVLVTFMSKDINGHADKKRDVLLGNSPLPEHAKTMLANYWLPAPMKQQVENAQNGTNAITAKEMEITDLQSERQRVLYKFASMQLSKDTIPEARDTLISFLEDEDDYKANYFLLPLLIKTSQWDEFTTRLQDLVTLAGTLQEPQRTELLTYCQYINIAKNYVESNYDVGIVKGNIRFLESIAQDDNNMVQILAQILLEQAYPKKYDYPEKIDLPKNDNPKSLLEYINKDQEPYSEIIQVYPNPANTEITIKYNLPETIQNCTINLYDTKGKLLISRNVTTETGSIVFNTSHLPTGNYIISVSKIGEKDYTKQISILH